MDVIDKKRLKDIEESVDSLDYEMQDAVNFLLKQVSRLSWKVECQRNEVLDGAEKEYLLDKKCNELRAELKKASDLIDDLLDTLDMADYWSCKDASNRVREYKGLPQKDFND